jgi:hypothetical protein
MQLDYMQKTKYNEEHSIKCVATITFLWIKVHTKQMAIQGISIYYHNSYKYS